MAKKYLNFKFSEFTTNKNFSFRRKKILKVLPGRHLLDAHKVISKWKGYKKTPLINLEILSKKLNTNKQFVLGLEYKNYVDSSVAYISDNKIADLFLDETYRKLKSNEFNSLVSFLETSIIA